MQRRDRPWRQGTTVVVLCFVASILVRAAEPPAATGQSDGPAQSGIRIASALRFVQAVYPDQEDMSGRVQIQGELLRGMDTRHFEVQLGGSLLTLRNEADLNRAQCYGRFRFTDFGLVEFYGHGACVRADNNAAFVSSVKAHSQWTDEQIGAELARRGAEFGPGTKDRLKDRIPIFVIGDAVGESVEVRDISFRMPNREGGKIDLKAVDLLWNATLSVLGKHDVTVRFCWSHSLADLRRFFANHPIDLVAM